MGERDRLVFRQPLAEDRVQGEYLGQPEGQWKRRGARGDVQFREVKTAVRRTNETETWYSPFCV